MVFLSKPRRQAHRPSHRLLLPEKEKKKEKKKKKPKERNEVVVLKERGVDNPQASALNPDSLFRGGGPEDWEGCSYGKPFDLCWVHRKG